MSIPTMEQTSAFLAPLRGSIAILLLHDPQVKVRLSRFLLACAGAQSLNTTILDSDAFFCTNMDGFSKDAQFAPQGEILLLPDARFEVGCLLPLLSSKREMLIIDDLNSLYSLATDGRKSHQLTIIMKLLSYNAKVNGSWIITTAYRTELTQRQTKKSQWSLTALGDLLIDTHLHHDSIKLKASFKDYWPGGEFSI